MDTNLTSDPAALPATSGEEFFRVEGIFRGLAAPIPGGGLVRWILGEGPHIDNEAEFFDELCWRLVGDGVPLWRASLHISTLHPQIRGFGARWWRERKMTEEYRILHGSQTTEEYLKSPIRATIERGVKFRRRLVEADGEYPLLTRLRKAGGSDYFALPLNRTLQRHPVVTWATDHPQGFAAAEIAALEEINPALAAIIETRAVRHISFNLLDTYLGPLAGKRILAGQVRRGQGDRLPAAIMITDLRGFTGLSDRLADEAVLRLLDDYFDAVASSVQEQRGEVLKFIGDGVLAIFPAEDDRDFAAAARALGAATETLARIDAANRARRGADSVAFRAGVGLHFGEVTFGNVGAADRLDFTVIGPAVNLASRIEGLTKRLLRPLLTSRAFARICPQRLISLGYHPVRGLNQPEEVFGLPE
ncbi:MAG TPA: adenylate/guanylate cyclase domain-containing protein [Stellaceae bacterium]|nr:adenylate/guanylate cyclase domain-containing protein [Stellaceae bacterium]